MRLNPRAKLFAPGRAEGGQVSFCNFLVMVSRPVSQHPHRDAHEASKLLLTVAETCHLTSLGRSSLYSLILSGALPSVKCGKRRLIPREALDEFIARLRAEQVGAVNGGTE